MLKRTSLGLLAASGAELPTHALTRLPRLVIDVGGSVYIEGHRGILEYGDEIIDVSGGEIKLRIRGEKLELLYMGEGDMSVGGRIFSVEFI